VKRFLPYLKYLKPVRLAFAFALFCGIIFGISSGFGLPFMAAKVFPVIFESEGSAYFSNDLANSLHPGQTDRLNEFLDDLLQPAQKAEIGWSEPAAAPSPWFLLGVVMLLPFAFLIRGASGFGNAYWTQYCGVRVLEQIRIQLFDKFQSLPLAFHQRHRAGDLIARAMNDTQILQQVLVFVANDLIKQPITFLGAIGALIYLSVQQKEIAFFLLCLLVVPLCVLPIRYVGRRMLVRAREMQHQAGDLTGLLNENLSAPREIRSFNLQERESRRFRESVSRYVRFQMKVVKYSKILSPSIEILAATGIALAVYYSARAGLTLEQVVPLVFALYMSYDPIKKMGAIHSQFRQGAAALDRIEKILQADDVIHDPPHPVYLPPDSPGEVTFRKVTFAYDEVPALRDVDLTIRAGQVVALVGPSGAGKSTFASLIPRFYEVGAGAVTIDGVDVRACTKQNLRERIALVSQEPILFNDTLFNNIRIGRPDASEAEVYQAARQAMADSFIEEFTEGYQTWIGERGTRLSGGQKQRIALARAFLKNAPILILDEATSALDAESERHIQSALQKLVLGKTAFIIAHRFSTIRFATRILVFDQSRIIADGPHESLIETCPLYRVLWERQFNDT